MLNFKDMKIFASIFGGNDSAEINKLLEQLLPANAMLAGTQLKRNGIGVRKKLGLLIYNIALYLPEKTTDATKAIYMEGAKQIRFIPRRDFGGSTLAASFLNDISRVAPEEIKKQAFEQMSIVVQRFKDGLNVKIGDVFRMDLLPKVGAHFYLNDELLAETQFIPGFHESIIKIWLSDKPNDPTCKAGLLGA